MTRSNSWNEAVVLHESAIAAFTEASLKVADENWSNAENDAWAPAHVTEHLTLVYQVLLKELQGGPGMKIRTNFVTRRLLRWFLVPRMLRGDGFPRARAPRETRPVLPEQKDRNTAIQELRELAKRFQQTIQMLFEEKPKMQLTHAYFGRAGLQQSLLLCARHIEHHARELNHGNGKNQKL